MSSRYDIEMETRYMMHIRFMRPSQRGSETAAPSEFGLVHESATLLDSSIAFSLRFMGSIKTSARVEYSVTLATYSKDLTEHANTH